MDSFGHPINAADVDASCPGNEQGRRVFIKTYGCQMNVYDSQRMLDVLRPLGFAPSEAMDDADLVILNTCHIREKAEDKIYSDLGRVRVERERMKSEGKRMMIGVGGCVAQAQGEEVRRRAPYVDMVFGPQSYHLLPELVTKAIRGQGGVVEVNFPTQPKFDFLPTPGARGAASAFVAVQEGCDKFCTFCVVPYTRGAEYSRAVAEVLKEVQQLAEQGVREVTLLGQNVNAYHGAGADGKPASLAALMQEIAEKTEIQRIRYTTSHPRDMSEDLIAIHGTQPKVMPFLHLPVQSGSDTILKRMNRKHTSEEYLRIIERVRASRPDIALSSDFIVGFPGETEADFEATLALVREVKFSSAYSFAYSPRPGTPAALEEVQVEDEVKSHRLTQLQALLEAQQGAFNQASVGQEVDVLLEKRGRFEGQLTGRTPHMQSVHVMAGEELLGRIVRLRITQATSHSVTGQIVSTSTGEPSMHSQRSAA